MPTVTESVELPADVDATRTLVQVQLYQAGKTPLTEARDSVTGDTIAGRRVVVLDGTTPESPSVGAWSLVLTGNTNIVPSGTVWGRRLMGPQIDDTLSYATVAAAGGPYQWQQILTDPPAALAPAGLSAHAADALLHGGGQLLAYADRASSFTTASVTAVDVTGVTITFDVPPGPYAVEVGAFGLFEERRTGQVAITSGSRTGGVTTMNTGAAHGLTRGRSVAVATPGDTSYNGTWAVASIPTSTQFTYSQPDGADDAGSGTGTVAPAELPGAGGTLQITLSDNTIIGQDAGRAAIDNDLAFLNRRTVIPNVHHAPTVGQPITYKARALTSAATSDFTLIGPFFGFDDQPYIMAYTLGEG